MHSTCIKIRCCSQDFLLFKLPASFSTAVSRASPNQTTCGLSNPPQWHCGRSAFGIRAAVACGSGALCVKWKLLSVHCSCNVYQKLPFLSQIISLLYRKLLSAWTAILRSPTMLWAWCLHSQSFKTFSIFMQSSD